MTLRTRLFVTSGLIAVPLIVALFLIDERFRLANHPQWPHLGTEVFLCGGRQRVRYSA